MRWPLGRRATLPVEAAAPAPARPHDAWRTAAPLQRASGDPPVVAPVRPFAASLATRNPPELALQGLGHEVSSLAGSGLIIGGPARPVEAPGTGGVELPLQRNALDRAGVADPAARQLPSADPAFASSAGDDQAGAVSDGAAVQRAASPDLWMTSSSGVGLPGRPAGLLDLRPLTSDPPDRLITPAPVQRPAASPVQRIEADPVHDPHPATTVRRPSLGQARRLGLGAPLEPTLQRTSQPPPVVAAGARTPELPPAGADGQHGVALAGAALAGAALAGAALTPGPPSRGPEGPGRPNAGAAPTSDEATGSNARGMGGLELVQPLSIQRLGPPGWIGSGQGGPSTRATDQAPLTLSDGHANGPIPGVARLTASAAFEPAMSVGSGIGPGGGPAAGTETSPVLTSSILTGRSEPRSGFGSPLVQRLGRPGEAAGAPPPGQVLARFADDPGHPFPLRLPGSGTEPAGTTGPGLAVTPMPMPMTGPSIQRNVVPAEVESGVERTAMPPRPGPAAVQRAIQLPDLNIGANPPAPAPAGPSAATPAAVSASPANQERELDELARRLYGRIRSRLAAELLADRERAGMITDLR